MILIDPLIYKNNDDNEVWKPLIYNNVNQGEYLISNKGNVYDLKKGKYLNQYYDKDGYFHVSLRGQGAVGVHRLVANNFVFEKRYDQSTVNHINGIKSDNSNTNLEWLTTAENTYHAHDTGITPTTVLSVELAENICQLLSKGMTYNEILDAIGFEKTDNNRDLIGNIYRGIAWGRISKKYEFPEIDQRFRSISRDQVNQICEYIVQGYTNREVYEKVFGNVEKGSTVYKNRYESIRLIRNRKMFTDISSNYNF